MVKGFEPSSDTMTTAAAAETRCPPTRFLGWARGDSLAPKSRTAEAPKEPINSGKPAILVIARMARIDKVPLISPQVAYVSDLGACVPLSFPFIFPGILASLFFT